MSSQRPRDVQHTLGKLRAHMARFGYQPADVPIIQPADLFLTRAGDQIVYRLFTFERHGVPLALRPEFTSPALRRYLREYSNGGAPIVRWQFAGIIFEDDPDNRGPDYERVSSGAECFGLPGAGAEAEIIGMAVEGCHSLGLAAVHVTLGNVQLVRRLLAAHELDLRAQQFVLSHLTALQDAARGVDYVLDRFDALLAMPSAALSMVTDSGAREAFELALDSIERGQTMGGRTQADIARRLIQKHRRAAQRPRMEAALRLLVDLSHIDSGFDVAFGQLRRLLSAHEQTVSAVLDTWEETARLLLAYGLPASHVHIQPILARDWEYYSGLVFEVFFEDASGLKHHVAGGGRYDELARLLGASVDVPAVGCVYYLDTLLACTPQPGTSPRALSLIASPSDAAAIRWTRALRGLNLPVEIVPTPDDTRLVATIESPDVLRFQATTYPIDQLDRLAAAVNEFLR